jgi:hypothetical protein
MKLGVALESKARLGEESEATHRPSILRQAEGVSRPQLSVCQRVRASRRLAVDRLDQS